MQRAEVLKQLKDYISFEVLNGNAFSLDESTPLLEWGILNSLEMTRILAFITEQFNVKVPSNKVIPEHFKDIKSLADLVLNLANKQLTDVA